MRKTRDNIINTEDHYFDWLVNTYTYFNGPIAKYLFLAKILFEIPFIHIHRMDENRLMDGVHVRKNYKENYALDPDDVIIARECNVLELLIGIALRMSDTLDGAIDFDSSPQECMVIMIRNLGLEKYTDDYVFSIKTEKALNRIEDNIFNIIDRFIHKEYDYYGRGGLFPLKDPIEDQRTVEIWIQMNAYMLENYDFGIERFR